MLKRRRVLFSNSSIEYSEPTGKTLYYNGSQQELLNPGVTSAGEFLYGLSTPGSATSYAYTGSVQSVTLSPGIYKFQCWGAQGGNYSTTYVGGKGGYAEGTISLSSSTTVYIYVGGPGTGGTSTGTKAGGFNGGGKGYSSNANYQGGSGGGASDIRIGTDSLYSRVIVAGGGGGAASYDSRSSRKCSGGAGGGTSGITGSQYSNSYRAGTGGLQTSRGTSYYGTTANSTSYGTLAAFGTGGGAAGTLYNITGGGGGWYGGGYAQRASGGGGSGYVYTSSTASNYPSGCTLNSNYYMVDAYTTAGNASFPTTSGSGTETGHTGNGYVKITPLTSLPSTWYSYVPSATNVDTYYVYWKLVNNNVDIIEPTIIPVTINKGNGYVSVSGRSLTYNRSAQNLVTVSGATGTVHYRLGTSGSWTTTIPTSTNAGTYTVYYYVDASTNYNGLYSSSSPGSVSATISKVTPVLSSAPTLQSGLVYNGSSQNLLSGGAMKHSSSDSTAVSGTFSYTSQTNPGTYSNPTWSFTPSDTTNYNSTNGTVTGNVTIAKITRTISFDNLQYTVEPNSTIQLSATPSADPSGGTITYSVVSGTVNINSSTGLVTTNSWEGTCTIQASISASTYYSSATTTCTLTVFTTTHNYSYTGSSQSITLIPGTYKLQCWGAQGGSIDTTYIGGKGGYSVGIITISTNTTAYIYVGGQGTGGTSTGTKAGGFNGGGAGYSTSTTFVEEAGGGASDIRIGTNSLYSRVIVAGGGGGAGSYNYTPKYSGGAGGGTSGITGQQYSTRWRAGIGGSQTSGGTSYYGATSNPTSNGTLAAFGVGGGANTTLYQITGGGGGWYGGGYSRRGPGGGGSGYVYTSSTYSNYPSGCTLNSSYYLSGASTTAGNTSFESTSGSTETGHVGNGYVRITMIEIINISGATVTGTPKTYTGSALTTTVTVTLNGTTIPSSGYTATFSNNINAGTATITVTGKGDYAGTATGTFIINKATPTYTAPTGKSLTYTGSAQQLLNAGSTSHGTIYYWGTLNTAPTSSQWSSMTNWSTTIPSATNAGTYSVYWKLVGDSNHNDVTNTSALTATILDSVNLSDSTYTLVTLSQDTYTFDGTPKCPDVTVRYNENIISSDQYSVEYYYNIYPGTPFVSITGRTSTCTGSTSVSFIINKAADATYIHPLRTEGTATSNTNRRITSYKMFNGKVLLAGMGGWMPCAEDIWDDDTEWYISNPNNSIPGYQAYQSFSNYMIEDSWSIMMLMYMNNTNSAVTIPVKYKMDHLDGEGLWNSLYQKIELYGPINVDLSSIDPFEILNSHYSQLYPSNYTNTISNLWDDGSDWTDKNLTIPTGQGYYLIGFYQGANEEGGTLFRIDNCGYIAFPIEYHIGFIGLSFNKSWWSVNNAGSVISYSNGYVLPFLDGVITLDDFINWDAGEDLCNNIMLSIQIRYDVCDRFGADPYQITPLVIGCPWEMRDVGRLTSTQQNPNPIYIDVLSGTNSLYPNGVYPNKLEIQFMADTVIAQERILAFSNTTSSINIYVNGNQKIATSVNSDWSTNNSISGGSSCVVVMTNLYSGTVSTQVTTGGNTYSWSNNTSTNIIDSAFTLFAANSTGTSYPFDGRIYYVKMWDSNNKLILNLVPIAFKYPSGTNNGSYSYSAGYFYDLVNGNLYGTAGFFIDED